MLTDKVGAGTTICTHNYLLVLEKTKSPAVLRRTWQHASQLARPLLQAALQKLDDIHLKKRCFAQSQRHQNFGIPFMPPIFFIIFIMPLPFIFFIMPCICSNSLSKRLTS